MPPQPRLAIIATVQQAISDLLMTYEPEFLRFGFSLRYAAAKRWTPCDYPTVFAAK